MSKSFKRVTQNNRKKGSKKDPHLYYEAYSPLLVHNKNDNQIQDLFAHSMDKEKRIRQLEDLKKAKEDLL